MMLRCQWRRLLAVPVDWHVNYKLWMYQFLLLKNVESSYLYSFDRNWEKRWNTYMVWSRTLSTVISALISDTVVSFRIPGTNSWPSPFTVPGDFDPKMKNQQFIHAKYVPYFIVKQHLADIIHYYLGPVFHLVGSAWQRQSLCRPNLH